MTSTYLIPSIFLSFTAFLFLIGILGMVLNRKNIIAMIMALEIAFLSANLNFVYFAMYNLEKQGHLMAIYILTIAGAEAAIGLAIFLAYYHTSGCTGMRQISLRL